jgi:hypothetical protein
MKNKFKKAAKDTVKKVQKQINKNYRKLQDTKKPAADTNEKTNTPAVKTIPGPVFVTNGSYKGEIHLQWDAVKEANHYAVQLSKMGTADKSETGWLQVDIISDPCYSMEGLKSGKSYSFRISAIFSEGQGPWSEAVTKKIK